MGSPGFVTIACTGNHDQVSDSAPVPCPRLRPGEPYRGYGYRGYRGYRGYGYRYGKRSAEPEPLAGPEPNPEPYYGYYGRGYYGGYRGYGGYYGYGRYYG